ncbi:MAG: AarF/ABC1/UbiB kinase family protein [Acidimicrobiales bacterium]|nr:AarF/ABC1/UbiB kinase family protein [Acidimicrobiales bacterium]
MIESRALTKAFGPPVKHNRGILLRRVIALTANTLWVLVGVALDRMLQPSGDFDLRLAGRVRRAFERLGPTFVKAGQLLSSSPGSLPKSWVDEMAHCRDDVPTASWKSVSRLLAAELGGRRQLLGRIDEAPMAGASIAQVHAAELADGTPVVVKVQRPGLENVLAGDIRVLRVVARLAARLSPTCAAANPALLVDDFAKELSEQLSFHQEIANLQTMSRVLADLPVRVPRVFAELSSGRVMIMERLNGVAIDDTLAMEAHGLDRTDIVRTVLASLILPALGQGIFHGDMHAGNMMVLADGRLGLMDFGILGHLDPVARAMGSQILHAGVNRRFGEVAGATLMMANATKVDGTTAIPELGDFLTCHFDPSSGDLDVAEVLRGILRLAARHGCALPESLVGFFKQLVYVDGVCRKLSPDFDVLDDLAPIVSVACSDQSSWLAGEATIAA